MTVTYIVIHELPSTGLKHCCLLTNDYYKAVGFVECEVQRLIDYGHTEKSRTGEEDEIVTNVERFGYVEGDEAQCWEVKKTNKEFTELFYIYWLENKEDNTNEK